MRALVLAAMLTSATDLAQVFQAQDGGQPVVPTELQEYFRAQPEHLQALMAKKMEEGLIGGPQHVSWLLGLRLSGQNLEWLLSDNCLLCHSNPEAQLEETLFRPGASVRSLSEVVNDAHFRRGLSCSGCHGGEPTDQVMTPEIYARWPPEPQRSEERSWIPAFCARCHSDPQFMRQFAPKLPTDQLAKYRTSHHGELLLEEKDPKAAQCVSCHGVHGIRAASSPRSKVHPAQVPFTCGACHADPAYMAGYTVDGGPIPTDQLRGYRRSVHGKAVLEKADYGAPACNDCHGNHTAMPPGVAQVSLVCRTCHGAEANYFDASKHKQAFDRHGWPECVQCHGSHLVERPSEAMLANEPGTLCFDCHRSYARDNPRCTTLTAYFRQRIEGLQAAASGLEERSERLAERGLNVEPLQATLTEIEDALKNSRTRVHAFEKSTFDESADEGQAAVHKAQGQVEELRSDYRYRTGGLLVSVAVMGVLAIALWLRLRGMERR